MQTVLVLKNETLAVFQLKEWVFINFSGKTAKLLLPPMSWRKRKKEKKSKEIFPAITNNCKHIYF